MDGQPVRSSLAVVRDAFACGDDLARTILAQCRETAARSGALLWPRGEDRPETVLLLHGTARELTYGRSGVMLVFHQLECGELFGALVTVETAGSAVRVEAVTAARIACFAADVLVRLMESYSAVAMAMTRQLARRLDQMRHRMADTVLLSAKGRVCAELLRLGQASEDRTISPLPVFTDLALITQTTRETVSRTISELEKRGIVARVTDGLQVVAPHRLEEMAY